MGQKAEKNIPDKRFPTANQKRDFSANVALWYKKGTSQLSNGSPKTALQGLSPDGLHGREPILHIFSAKVVGKKSSDWHPKHKNQK
jgi:hypothetical protein